MKLKLPTPGTYGQAEAEGTPEELAAFFKALGTEQPAPVLIPTMWTLDVCPMGGAHEYPTAWWGTTAPACTKCGQVTWAQPHFEVTWSTLDSKNPMPPCRTEIVTHTTAPAAPVVGRRGPLGCTD